MAAELLGLTMIGEGDTAVRTLGHVPAIRALQGGRITATIEEENRLLFSLQPSCDRLLQFFGENRSALLFSVFFAHVDDTHNRHSLFVDPRGQLEQAVFAAFDVVEALHRGGRRAEHDDSALHLSADDGHIPGVVARRFLLLVGMLVLLIHDYESDRVNRGEDCRTGANDNAGPALTDFMPLIVAFAGGEMAVQHGDKRLQRTGAEPGFEALDRLRSERYLRHQDDGPFFLVERLRDRLQIDFRLSAACDSMEEENLLSCRLHPIGSSGGGLCGFTAYGPGSSHV